METGGLGRIRHLCIVAREKRATTQQPKPNPNDLSFDPKEVKEGGHLRREKAELRNHVHRVFGISKTYTN
jgi:hypothetical protein